MGNKNLIKIIGKALHDQWAKGFKKYGQTIEECPPDAYDWNLMALEELADGITYLAKENKRLKDRIKELENNNK